MKHSIDPAKLLRCGNQDVYWLSSDEAVSDTALWSSLHVDDASYAKTIKSTVRLAEFLRSRWLMKKIGVLPEFEPTRGSDGVPRFKGNIPGSISHKAGQVVCASDEKLASIGIDLEFVGKVHAGLAEKICIPSELALLDSIFPGRGLDWNKGLCLIFSFKEALFKAHYPLGRTMFWFHDAQVLSIPQSLEDTGTITGKVLKDTSPQTPPETELTASFMVTNAAGILDDSGAYITTVVQVQSH